MTPENEALTIDLLAEALRQERLRGEYWLYLIENLLAFKPERDQFAGESDPEDVAWSEISQIAYIHRNNKHYKNYYRKDE
jgi:hypothetical protein